MLSDCDVSPAGLAWQSGCGGILTRLDFTEDATAGGSKSFLDLSIGYLLRMISVYPDLWKICWRLLFAVPP